MDAISVINVTIYDLLLNCYLTVTAAIGRTSGVHRAENPPLRHRIMDMHRHSDAFCDCDPFGGERWTYTPIMYKLRPKPNVYRSRQAFIS
jgi:hypothetical protein